MTIPNYQGAVDGGEIIRDGLNEFRKVYNDIGAAVTNGDVYVLSYEKDADSLSPSARPTLTAVPASSAIYQHIAVVNNAMNGKDTIADGEWGWVQTAGHCPDVNSDAAGSIAVDRYVEAKKSTAVVIDSGTARTVYTFAILTSAVFSTTHFEAFLFGDRALVQA
jgi:hypothetical protein